MAKQETEFVPPKTWVGQTVYWHHGSTINLESPNPVTAIVTQVCGGGRVRLAIIAVDNTGFNAPDDPVPYKGDPAARRLVENDPDSGVWEECPAVLTPGEVDTIRSIIKEFGAKPAK